MDFIASGLVEMVGGLRRPLVLAAYAWWAPLLLVGAWLATHWLLRESASGAIAIRKRFARRNATPTMLIGWRSIRRPRRSCGFSGSQRGRSSGSPRDAGRLLDLQWQATRLREQPVLWSLLLVLAANLIVFWAHGRGRCGRAPRRWVTVVTFASAAVSTSMIAFGGLSWALDGAAAPAAAVLRLREAMAPAGSAYARRSRRRRTCRRGRSGFAM